MRIEGLDNFKEIGRGGFGVVYRAEQPAYRRTVAVKVMPASDDATAQARFARECQALGSLSTHPNIVTLHASGLTGTGAPYLVMDFLPGGSLADRVHKEGSLTVDVALRIIVALAGALTTAHRQSVVHRDVKPENVLFSAYGEPQLVDFGISRMSDAYETRSGVISATLIYAAPEVLDGAPASAASDQYSLAAVGCFLLSGRPPFAKEPDETTARLLTRILTEPPPDLAERAGVPASVAAVLRRGLAKRPEERFADAEAFGRELQRVAESLGHAPPTMVVAAVSEPVVTDAIGDAITADIAAGSQPTVENAVSATIPRPVARRPQRARWLIGAAVVAALLGVGVTLALTGGDPNEPAASAPSTMASASGSTKESSTRSVSDVSIGATTTAAGPAPTEPPAPSSATTGSTVVNVTRTAAASPPETSATTSSTTNSTAPPTSSVTTSTSSSTTATTTTVALVTVPNVVGNDVNTGVFTLEQVGFVVSREVDNSCSTSGIVRQSPAAGTLAPRGSTITITRCNA